ncbi:MAG: PH domain-containing protein, partial [Phycisphaerales bacterium]|nr:PH domain-containing protein [Phycisphaerales bacterium]
MNYSHTQRAPPWWLLAAIGAAAIVVASLLHVHWQIALIVASLGAAILVLAVCFQTLTVADEGDSLAIRYGPLPLFHKRIPYQTIREVEPSRSAFIDGWGIHYIPGRGWTSNLWGTQCVRLRVDDRTVRIGTDDP